MTGVRKRRIIKDSGIYFMVLPAFIVIILIMVYPLIYGFYLSFYETLLGFSDKKFVFFSNYWTVFRYPQFFQAFKQTLYFTFFSVVGQISIAMIAALIMNTKLILGKIFRCVVLIPWVSSFVVVAFIWMWIYHGTFGILNDLLQKIGLFSQENQIGWLSGKEFALNSIILTNIWRGFPLASIMFLAALEGISIEFYEASKIDGANCIQMFKYITLPMLKPTIYVSTLFSTIWTFNYFGLIWLMTRGGPLGFSEVLATYLYKKAFTDFQLGEACAIGVIMFFIMTIFAFFYNYVYKLRET